jgi:hypothetical protein
LLLPSDIDRLVGVPNVQPPLPTDWEVHPTHTIHVNVPYHVAQYWDKGVRQRIEEKTAALNNARKRQQRQNGSATGIGVGEVPRDLRDTAKRTPAVKGWVRVLEEPIRRFLVDQRERVESKASVEADLDDSAGDDEEIVFSGRTGAMQELKEKKDLWKKARREGGKEKEVGMVFDSLGDDESASFKYVSQSCHSFILFRLTT